MKKLYTLALASAVALSSVAMTKQTAATLTVKPQLSFNGQVKELPLADKMKKAPAKAPAVADLAGLQYWDTYSLLQNGGDARYQISVEVVDAAAGKLEVSLGGSFVLDATYDASKGTLTIPRQYVTEDEDGPVYFYIKDVDDDYNIVDGESATKAETVATFTKDAFYFDAMDIWALGDPDNEGLGWYVLASDNVFSENGVSSEDPEEPEYEYVNIGTADFVENMLYGWFFGEEGTDGSWTAEENTTVSKHAIYSDGKGHYKLDDPLQVAYGRLGIDGVSPSLELDATDPDNVLIGITSSGLSLQGNVLCYFCEQFWCDLSGDEFDPALAIKKTVDGDSKVTITIPYQSITIWLYGTQSFGYAADFVSTLTFTEDAAGVNNVVVDNNAPVKYYNLQGVQVQDPRGLVIRVQGDKAVKAFVK